MYALSIHLDVCSGGGHFVERNNRSSSLAGALFTRNVVGSVPSQRHFLGPGLTSIHSRAHPRFLNAFDIGIALRLTGPTFSACIVECSARIACGVGSYSVVS